MAETIKMRISLPGVLDAPCRDLEAYERACADARRTQETECLPDPGEWFWPQPRIQTAENHRFMLKDHLLKHLQQVRDRVMAGDLAAIDDFFGLYVFDDDVEYIPIKQETTSDD